MTEAQARVCAAVLLLECPGAHPDGTEYNSTQLGEYFKIEPDGIRAAKRTWKDDGLQRKTTINLFKSGFYAWPTIPAAAPAAVELAQVEPTISSPARHVEAWREARTRTRAGESADAVAQSVAARWNVPFSRSKAYEAKKPGSKTPKRPSKPVRIDAELEQALATMIEQLNTMDFTVFTEDVKGAEKRRLPLPVATTTTSEWVQKHAQGPPASWVREISFSNKKKSAPYSY